MLHDLRLILKMNVNIGSANQVYNGDQQNFIFSHNGDPLNQTSSTPSTQNGSPTVNNDERGQPDTVDNVQRGLTDTNGFPDQQDTSVPTTDGNMSTNTAPNPNHVQEFGFRTPVQASGESNSKSYHSLEETSYSTPVSATQSSDYMSVGHTPGDLEPDVATSATAMEDLKLPVMRGSSSFTEDTGPSSQASVHSRSQNQDQTSQNYRTQQEQASPGHGTPSAQAFSKKQTFSSVGEQTDSGIGPFFDSLTTDGGGIGGNQALHGLDFFNSGDPARPTSSLTSSSEIFIQCDGGGEGLASAGLEVMGQSVPPPAEDAPKDIIVAIRGCQLLQDDDDPKICVVKLYTEDDILKAGQQNGYFPGGAPKLLRVTWFGHRWLKHTRWLFKLNTDREASQQELVRLLSASFLEHDVKPVRHVMKQLNHGYSIYLQQIVWDDGVVVYLGHANLDKCEKCMAQPLQREIETFLWQFLPDCAAGSLTLDSVTLVRDDEAVDLGLNTQMVVSGGTFRSSSFNSSDMYDSLRSPGSSTGNSGTFPGSRSHDSILSDAESRNQPSPSVDTLETSSQSSVQVISPENSNGNGATLESLRISQNEQRFQTLQNELAAQKALLQHEIDGLRQSMLEMQEGLDKVGEDNCASVKHVKSTLQKSLEAVNKDVVSQVADMAAKFEEQKSLINVIQDDGKKLHERMACLQQNMQDRDSSFQLAQEDMKHLYATYEIRGRRLLDGAVRQVLDTGLQRAELEAQRDKRLELMLQKFQAEVLARVQHCEKFTKEMQQQIEEESKRQVSLMEISQLRQEFEIFKAQHGRQNTTNTVGAVFEGVSKPDAELGAVGGKSYPYSSFTRVLRESEAVTTKLNGTKEEEMSFNQFESLRLPDTLLTNPAAAAFAKPKPFDSDTNNTSPKTYADAAARQPDSQKKSGQYGSKNSARKSPNGSDTSSSSSNSKKDRRTMQSSPDRNGRGASREILSPDLTRAEQFLDWISIRGSLRGQSDLAQRLTQSVGYALLEEEMPAPRAKCLDTILCLDVSESIVQDGYLDAVKKTALKFVDGIEDLMDEMDLEENVAVVAMGGGARVVQHLTNDLTLVREAIESLDDFGGRSPFMEALLVCLAANKGRGGIVNVSGVYKVRPRIIFITDGRPTDETVETGPDVQSNLNQVKFSLVQLLSELSSKKHKSTPKPIMWVPAGKSADKQFMESLASLSGGELVDCEEPTGIENLCRYYKVQQTIGRVYKMVKNHKDDYSTDERLSNLVGAISAHMKTRETALVVENVKKLQKEPTEEEEPDADDFSNVFEDEEKVKNGVLPPLGTRVRRGPHWKWKNQDTDGPGTVIQHSKSDNWIYVKWDNGTYNAYRWNEDDRYDLQQTDHDPRDPPPDKDALDFGVRVVRGPNWKFENQDGEGAGTVIRVRDSGGIVKVRWDVTGKVHEYNYSEEKGKEVQVIIPEFPRKEQQVPADTEHKDESQDPESEKTIPMWKWHDHMGRWRLYEEDVMNKLETEYKKRKQGSCIIVRAGTNRRVSFKAWQEKEVDGGPACDVEREMVDEERKNDLLAFDLSLQLN